MTGRVLFEFVLHYVITRTDDSDRGPWKVSTRGYSYGISTPDGVEVVVWHWHPTSKVSFPHHHVGRAVVRPDAVVTSKHHLPSERVSAEAVIRYCIEDLKVRPRRSDWRTVLADSEDLFKMWRTWPNPAPSSATRHRPAPGVKFLAWPKRGSVLPFVADHQHNRRSCMAQARVVISSVGQACP